MNDAEALCYFCHEPLDREPVAIDDAHEDCARDYILGRIELPEKAEVPA